MNQYNRVFLLGGHDLEMQTIREILVEENINFIDKDLKWGAKLSAYKNELEEFSDHTIYGIELEEDIAPPKNYQRIDHHNDFSDKEASIVQVLELLGKEPTREQELIAQNDVGHIEAMRCFGATEQEIKKIRKRDRVTQGVTAKEEAQALEEIESIKEEDGLYILKTSLDKFSPIVDNFDKLPFLLYSENSLTYYGEIEFLKEKYKEQISKNEAYHGRGFFGFDSNYVGSISSNVLAKEILELKKNVGDDCHHTKNIISYHNFMFPFRFDKLIEPIKDKHEFYRKYSFDERVKIDKDFKESLEKDNWEYQKFEVKNSLDYNEIVYFHDFVKDSLFNTQNFDKGATSYYFEKKIDDENFRLKIKGQDVYNLKLEGITLRLFDTGVGILSLEVSNYDYYRIEDILKINDYGRRVYPQFVGYDLNSDVTKKAFLPDYITVNGITELFGKKYEKIEIAKYIQEILGLHTFSTNQDRKNQNYIQPIIDDRMFVLCWYGNNEFSKCVKQDIAHKSWYKYVFVDGNDITIQDDEMHEEFIEKATYKRWKNYGTFYGITRYSFTCLSEQNDFTRQVLPLPHMKTMYFQMITLLLVQRASILRFSDEITAISDVRGGETPSVENISILYKNYLRFVNKLYFKEVTAQDQGIELYDKAIEIMNIKRDIEDLRQEIGSLNSYAFLEQEREEKEQMNRLTQLGSLFLPPTLLAGIYGMNIFDFNQSEDSIRIGIGAIFLVMLVGLALIYINKPKKNTDTLWEKTKKFFSSWKELLLGVLMTSIIIGSIVLIGDKNSSNSKHNETNKTKKEEKK